MFIERNVTINMDMDMACSPPEASVVHKVSVEHILELVRDLGTDDICVFDADTPLMEAGIMKVDSSRDRRW